MKASTVKTWVSSGVGLAFGLLLGLPLLAHSECPPPPTPPDAQQATATMRSGADHGFMWKISKEGHSSYLYGTLHAARKEWMFPGRRVAAALLASDVLAVELDMLDPAVVRELQSRSASDASDALPSALDQRLRRMSASECLPESVNQMAPELRIATLSMVAGRRDGIEPAYAIDLALTQIARAAQKKIVSLESPQQQMEALRAGKPEEKIAMLEREMSELEQGKTRAMLGKIAKAWSESNVSELERYPQWCECLQSESDRRIMQRMLDGRNPAMAEKIERLHQQGKRVFVAVGSLHMFGDIGLPALLARRGFQVERIELQPPENH